MCASHAPRTPARSAITRDDDVCDEAEEAEEVAGGSWCCECNNRRRCADARIAEATEHGTEEEGTCEDGDVADRGGDEGSAGAHAIVLRCNVSNSRAANRVSGQGVSRCFSIEFESGDAKARFSNLSAACPW